MDQQCQENTHEKMDLALLRMMMDLGYENIQPHHLVNMNLPYLAQLVLGIVICAAGIVQCGQKSKVTQNHLERQIGSGSSPYK